MNILITAGGTSERIDAVRVISNDSTGRLGSLIAECFVAGGASVFYVCGASALLPNGGATVARISDTEDLRRVVKELCASVHFDAVVHAAAVSDYRVTSISSGGTLLDRNVKISSALPELTVTLKPTPKIISLFSDIAPNACLVGFKLLDSVSRAELFEAAQKVLADNNCAFVLANDASRIHGDDHVGHLIGKYGAVVDFQTKQAIAEGIYYAVNTWSKR